MNSALLTTKLFRPQSRAGLVARPRLIEQLNQGLQRKLTLVSAPAGSGKTTLVGEWVADCGQPVAWLSLDEGDNDPARLVTYVVAALQTVMAGAGAGVLGALQSPQPPPIEAVLTALLNELADLPDDVVLVLDDYHLADAKAVDEALGFLLEGLPPQVRVVIATREDPHLPLARLRAQGQLAELRATDLRFTSAEAAEFLNQMMGLNLAEDDIAALETRTEGWIAGLQLAAISMQGHEDTAGFIKSFAGSHHFVMDYLLEEVLHQQPQSIQNFLLSTSILKRLCGPLCDAVALEPDAAGQETLEYLERANLFIVPLDNERRWYRYHHLFSDLLRQRLQQKSASSGGDGGPYHIRASEWYEANGMELEAFQHAAAANDIERATRLAEGGGMPLHFRGEVGLVLDWLASLPAEEMDARPTLWVMYASVLSMAGQNSESEQKLQAAEAALQGAKQDAVTRNLIGHIAAIRAVLAVADNDVGTIIAQSERALEYLHPHNLPVRTATTWKMGIAYHLQGNRAAAMEAYREAMAICDVTGNVVINIAATLGLGMVQESENQLYQAVEAYRRAVSIAGDLPQQVVCEAYLGLARISYEWNDLAAAQDYAQQSVRLARLVEHIDRYVSCEAFVARLKLAQGDVDGASDLLGKTEQSARQYNHRQRMGELAAAQVMVLLQQGNLAAAADIAETHNLPISRARVHLAQGDAPAALEVLEPVRQQAEAKHLADERLKVAILQALALDACGQKDEALQALGEALALAEPGGLVRTFVDEGVPMAELLSEAAAGGLMPHYADKLLAAFEAEGQAGVAAGQLLVDPLSERELEVLQLIAEGLSNREIGERLFVALDTVKGHNRKIFDKLQVQRRTEAVARARELGLL